MPQRLSGGIWIEMGPEWGRVERALLEAGVSADDDIKKAVEDKASPIVHDIQAHAMLLPARGVKHTGLRARLAAGVGVRPSVGGIRFTTSMTEPDEAALPRGMDSGEFGWRHPVYGNMNNWVHQRGGTWFRETIADDRDQIDQAVSDALEEVSNKIG